MNVNTVSGIIITEWVSKEEIQLAQMNKGGKFLKKRSDEGKTLETSALKLFRVANLCYQLG